MAPMKNISGLSEGRTLGKRVAAQALAWKQIGSIQYNNSNYSSIGAPVWELSSRDTTEYDADGNVVLDKTSSANSGWNTDSLTYIDSMVYSGGKLTEVFYYYNFMLGSGSSVTKSYYAISYLAGGKVLLEIGYTWNDTKKNWAPYFKDSIIYSSAPIPQTNTFEATNLLAYYQSRFDTISGLWKSAGYMQRVDAECNAYTLSLQGKTPPEYGPVDSLVDEKFIMTFNSTVWTPNTTVQERDQLLDPKTKTFYDCYKYVYTYNTAGFETGYQYFTFDSSAGALFCSYRNLYYPDSHGNDTLEVDYYYTSGVVSDSSFYRYARTYDAYGNNTQVIESYFDSYTDAWILSSKTINLFAQINSSVISLKQFESKRNISVTKNSGRLCFSGPNITCLMLYNASGRLLASVKQKEASSLVLDLPGQKARLVAGVYVARLLYDGKETSIPLTIGR